MSVLRRRKRCARSAVVGIVLFTMRVRLRLFAIGVFHLVVGCDVCDGHHDGGAWKGFFTFCFFARRHSVYFLMIFYDGFGSQGVCNKDQTRLCS